MRVAWHQDKVDQAASGIADTDDLAAETASGTARSLAIFAALAIESQT